MRALFVEHDTLDRLREWVVISFVGSANRAEGFVQGHAEGLAKGLSQGRIEMLCTLLGIPLGPREHEHLQSLNVEGLATLLAHLESERRWP